MSPHEELLQRSAALEHEATIALANEHMRPFMLLRPRMVIDGDQWCALYGDNIQDGVAGFGASPELAAADFDRAWREPMRTHQTSKGGK